jgi:hypothetical protein
MREKRSENGLIILYCKYLDFQCRYLVGICIVLSDPRDSIETGPEVQNASRARDVMLSIFKFFRQPEKFSESMAAPPPRLLPAKQPHLPDQRTPEQRYWRSFKVLRLPEIADS